ncbi:hypothetical protein [Calidifontibacter terrae]
MSTQQAAGAFGQRSRAASSRRQLRAAEKARQRKHHGLWARIFARHQRAAPARRELEPTRFGWEIPGGGSTVILDSPPEFRAPCCQIAGLYPFSAGGTLAMVGTALGPHLDGRGVVCADPVSFFVHGLINNPSAFVLGRPGLGKSSLVRHILVQLPDKGIIPLVLSDLKGEHVGLIRNALAGQVIAPGRGLEYVNPLDLGPLADRLAELPEELRRKAVGDMEGRRQNTMAGLCELALGRRLEAHERNVLNGAILGWVAQNPGQTPVVADLLVYVQSRPQNLAVIVQSRGETARYDTRVEHLVDALLALAGDGVFGDVFAHPTTTPLQMHAPAVFDLSAVDAMDQTLQAGLQLVCWSYGSAAVTAAKYLADAGLAPRRTYCMLMDELWKALRAAEFMVDRVDEITRLNRTLNLAQVLITHTMNDLKLSTPDATEKAFGFVARSEMVYLGGLAPGEMGNLQQVFAMSRKEEGWVTSWSTPGRTNPTTGETDPPPGRGKFLLKIGKDTGIPFQVQLVEAEKALNDTNTNWQHTIDSLTLNLAKKQA